MKRICAWCKKDLGEKEPREDKSITHGICDECADKYGFRKKDKSTGGTMKKNPERDWHAHQQTSYNVLRKNVKSETDKLYYEGKMDAHKDSVDEEDRRRFEKIMGNPPEKMKGFKWHMSAGGTGAPEGKHGFEAFTDKGRYMIAPVSTSGGKYLGYQLYFIDEKGIVGRGLYTKIGLYSRYNEAQRTAKEHYAGLSMIKNPPQFCPQRIEDPGKFDRRSFRTVKSGKHLITIGCPKGHYDAKKKICRVGTRIQRVLHPEGEKGVCPIVGKEIKRNPAEPKLMVWVHVKGERKGYSGYGDFNTIKEASDFYYRQWPYDLRKDFLAYVGTEDGRVIQTLASSKHGISSPLSSTSTEIRTGSIKTVSDIRSAHKGHWFDRSTMRFFGTKLYPTVYGGKYFITSEQPPHGPRIFSIREYDQANDDINTVGQLGQYATLKAAKDAVKSLAPAVPSKVRYIGKVVAPHGKYLLGGVRIHSSIPFDTYEDAEKWTQVIIKGNKEAGREIDYYNVKTVRYKNNPGAAYHREKSKKYKEMSRTAKSKVGHDILSGYAFAHGDSARASKDLGMNPPKGEKAYYVDWSSIFDRGKVGYDVVKIKEAIRRAGGTRIRLGNKFGWSNMPKVIIFNLPSHIDRHDVEKEIGEMLETEWVIVLPHWGKTKKNPVKRGWKKKGTKWYIGVTETAYVPFYSTVKPTKKKFPKFIKVFGPFKDHRALASYIERQHLTTPSTKKKSKLRDNPPGPVKIYDEILEIRAKKGKDCPGFPGELFKHPFKGGKAKAAIFGNPDGSLTVKGNKPLWNFFKYDK